MKGIIQTMKIIDNYISKHIKNNAKEKSRAHLYRFEKYSFFGNKCTSEVQYEAVITRLYHTIEKGLAYTDFKSGFGKNNLDALLSSMENYISDGFSPNAFFYKTALSTLHSYQDKNKNYGYTNEELNARIAKLPGEPNELGGIIEFDLPSKEQIQTMGFADLIVSRHSMRHFSDIPVEMDALKNAIELAQHTPSACNRQGWRTIIIADKGLIKKVLKNQNGNEGFGHEFDKLLLITADNRYFNRDRELFQVYIDGGMYAQNILNSLYYEYIASVPLSAALTKEQENNVRRLLGIHEAEELILFIGIGNYPGEHQTTKSERRHPNISIM